MHLIAELCRDISRNLIARAFDSSLRIQAVRFAVLHRIPSPVEKSMFRKSARLIRRKVTGFLHTIPMGFCVLLADVVFDIQQTARNYFGV